MEVRRDYRLHRHFYFQNLNLLNSCLPGSSTATTQDATRSCCCPTINPIASALYGCVRAELEGKRNS